ncbi:MULTISPECIES: hypothetical protein [unclassified Streptomyces]|uniref:hypothetical protein n=1 Tax=unclassified Streptomyces TaxID=2593676 RepID=UPI000978F8E0|nr:MULTISPECIES: hypothetical protein [unclassified Streptomyces]ONI54290.1 hypothetical protein STIB_20050 [Streptomyces sp. IB2014 011-1]RDV52466.1 hypothetical protein DDV98_09990 [Streptomyces sp. IB2014 011-12]
MTDLMNPSSTAGADGSSEAVASTDAEQAECEVRRVLAFQLGTTTRSELDDAAASLRGRVSALLGDPSAEEGKTHGGIADRGFLLEVTHLIDNPPAPHALSHEVYSHVRALARVLRKLVAMKRAAASVRPPLPVRPIPGRNAVR